MAASGVGAMGGEEREAGSSAAEGAPWTPQSHVAPPRPHPKKKAKKFPCSFESLVPGLIAAQQAVYAAPRRFRFVVTRPNTKKPQLGDLHHDASDALWEACRESVASARIKTPMKETYLDVEPQTMKGVLLEKGVPVQGAVVECLPTAKTTKALNAIESKHPVLGKLRHNSDLGLPVDIRPEHEAVLRGGVSGAFWEMVVEQPPDKDRLELAAVARASVVPSTSRPPVLRLKKVLFFLPLSLLSENRLLKASSKPHYMTCQAQVDKALDEAVKRAAVLLQRLEARPEFILDAHFKSDLAKTLMAEAEDEEDEDAPAPSQPLAEIEPPVEEAPPMVPKAPARKRKAIPTSPPDTPPPKGRGAGQGEASQPRPEAQEPAEVLEGIAASLPPVKTEPVETVPETVAEPSSVLSADLGPVKVEPEDGGWAALAGKERFQEAQTQLIAPREESVAAVGGTAELTEETGPSEVLEGIAKAPGKTSNTGVPLEDGPGTSAQAPATEERPGTSAKASTRSSRHQAAKNRLPEQPQRPISSDDEDEL